MTILRPVRFLLKPFSLVNFQMTLDKVYILSTFPKLPPPPTPHTRHTHTYSLTSGNGSKWLFMSTLRASGTQFWILSIHSANIYSTPTMPGYGAAKVNETPYLPSVLISLSQKSELGDSLVFLWKSECFSVLSWKRKRKYTLCLVFFELVATLTCF